MSWRWTCASISGAFPPGGARVLKRRQMLVGRPGPRGFVRQLTLQPRVLPLFRRELAVRMGPVLFCARSRRGPLHGV